MESRTASAPAADGGRRAGERAGTADVAIAAAILAGLVLRVAAARQKVLWFDEFLSANLIRHRWTDLLAAVRVEAHPPLYFVLLKLWCLPFGDGPAGLKSLSIVAGTAAAAVLADAVRRVRGDAAGIAAALLVSLANVQINQSSEAKPYAVLTFFLAALVWSIVRDRERPDGGSLASTWGAGAAAASTHFFGGAAAGAVALAAVLFGSRPERRRATTLFAIVLAVSAIWLVPAFSIPSGAADYIRDMWVGTG
ncbi:MAG TPA: glycosyltransferase family 39 protein, partial [Thermoanaerobaculia bacterium]|nr:glycosyltransferase family 39 protein [Thermoanaerobaculia bacterium]